MTTSLSDVSAPPLSRDQILRNLQLKGMHAQNQSELEFDWARPVRIPIWMPRKRAATAISQFYFGEVATADMCKRIGAHVSVGSARDFLETQSLDEERHAKIYLRYLRKLGGLGPLSSAVEHSYATALSWKGAPEAIILAFHVILEGEALRLQQDVDMWLPCPLFREVSTVIARDEARHIAFGKIYLREILPTLPLRERLDIYVWLKHLWYESALSVASRMAPPGMFIGRRRLSVWLARKWRERLGDLTSAGLIGDEELHRFETI